MNIQTAIISWIHNVVANHNSEFFFEDDKAPGNLGNQDIHCSLCKLHQNCFEIVKMQTVNVLWVHNTFSER